MNEIEANIQREFLLCPECGEYVHTTPAEGVPGQALRCCNKCEQTFFMDLDSKPVYVEPTKPECRAKEQRKKRAPLTSS